MFVLKIRFIIRRPHDSMAVSGSTFQTGEKMINKKILAIIFSLFFVFFGITSSFAIGDLTILYTGNTLGKIKPVRH